MTNVNLRVPGFGDQSVCFCNEQDLISRNTQAVTSGIYIWKVTSRLGSQVGKLVIIK